MVNFQTLKEFVDNPFGYSDMDKRSTLEGKYQSMKSNSKLKIAGYTIIDDNYLLHIQIPSDSNKSQVYDVVVLFFTDENTIKKRTTFSNYYVKFFSNSPSFIYQYAFLYKENGFLIDFLFDKLDSTYSDTAPTKSNKNFELFYDKSIYCACRFLLDNQDKYLSKMGIVLSHKKNETKFFSDIKTFENVKMSSELKNIDKKINKELEENKKVKNKESPTKARNSHKISSKSNTLGPGSKSVIRKIGGNKKNSHRVAKVKSTRKK